MNNTNLYLDFYGLHRYDEKIKKYIDNKTKIDNNTIVKDSSDQIKVSDTISELFEKLYLYNDTIKVVTGTDIEGFNNSINISGGSLSFTNGSIYATTGNFHFITGVSGFTMPNGGNVHTENSSIYLSGAHIYGLPSGLITLDNLSSELKEKIDSLKLTYGGLITPETDISTLNSNYWYLTDPNNPGTYEWINVNSAGRNRQESIITPLNSVYFFYPVAQDYFSMDGINSTHINWNYICLNLGEELSGITKINMSAEESSIIKNGKSIINSGDIQSDYIIASNSLSIGGSEASRYVPVLSMTPENIKFIRTSSGTIDNVTTISMNSGTISGVSNINSKNITGVNNISLVSKSGLVLKYDGIKAFTGEILDAEVSIENTLRICTGYNNRGVSSLKIIFDTPNSGILDMNGGNITGVSRIKIGTNTGIEIDSNTIKISDYSGEISFLSNVRLTTGATLNISDGYITGVNKLNITNGTLEIKGEGNYITGANVGLHFTNNNNDSNSIIIHKSGIIAGNSLFSGISFLDNVSMKDLYVLGQTYIKAKTTNNTSLLEIDRIVSDAAEFKYINVPTGGFIGFHSISSNMPKIEPDTSKNGILIRGNLTLESGGIFTSPYIESTSISTVNTSGLGLVLGTNGLIPLGGANITFAERNGNIGILDMGSSDIQNVQTIKMYTGGSVGAGISDVSNISMTEGHIDMDGGKIESVETITMLTGGSINLNNSTILRGNIINTTVVNNIYDGSNNTFTDSFINQLKVALGMN